MLFHFSHVKWIAVLQQILILSLVLLSATLIGLLFQRWGFPETNIVIIYLLSVLLTSVFTEGYGYGIVASIGATCLFNYFFTEPNYTFIVYDPSYFITFAVMTITSIITSTLTSNAIQNAVTSRKQEEETKALYQLTNQLTNASTMSQIASAAISSMSHALSCSVGCCCFDTDGEPEPSFLFQKKGSEQVTMPMNEGQEMKDNLSCLETDHAEGPNYYDWPIQEHNVILGMIRIPSDEAKKLTDAQKQLLHSMIENTALAMDRIHKEEERMRLHEEAQQEHYRSNLLRAISHDLRTPLSGIMGTSEMIMDMTDPDDERYSLAEGIYQDADWLHSIVENILSLTRLQDGKLILKREKEPVEEVIGVAVKVIEKREPGREIEVQVPDEVLMVPMDAKLIEQVLVNLLDNARKHTPKDREILVCAKCSKEENDAVFTVQDEGTGIAKEDLPHIFEMFYKSQGASADAQHGIGIGLSISESIVKAHGGTITAQNRIDRSGAVFTFTLPLEVPKE